MSYDDLYKRARKQLPEKVFEQSRFETPKIKSNIEGNKTFITNIRSVLSRMGRDEGHFLKFMAGELATSVVMEGTRAAFAGKHARSTLQSLLERYIKEYVLCQECGKPDTRLDSVYCFKSGIWNMFCVKNVESQIPDLKQ